MCAIGRKRNLLTFFNAWWGYIFITFVVCVFVLLAFFIRTALQPLPGRPQVAVAFLGYTNTAPLGRAAMFQLVNNSPWAVSRGSHCRVQAPAGRSFTNVWETWIPGRTLLQNESEVIIIPPPVGHSRWRISMSSHRDHGTLKSMILELTREMQKRGWINKRPPGRSYGFQSEWIDE